MGRRQAKALRQRGDQVAALAFGIFVSAGGRRGGCLDCLITRTERTFIGAKATHPRLQQFGNCGHRAADTDQSRTRSGLDHAGSMAAAASIAVVNR